MLAACRREGADQRERTRARSELAHRTIIVAFAARARKAPKACALPLPVQWRLPTSSGGVPTAVPRREDTTRLVMTPENVVEIKLEEHVIVARGEQACGDCHFTTPRVGDLARLTPNRELVIDVFRPGGVQRIAPIASEVIELRGRHDEGLQAPVGPHHIDRVYSWGAVSSDGRKVPIAEPWHREESASVACQLRIGGR